MEDENDRTQLLDEEDSLQNGTIRVTSILNDAEHRISDYRWKVFGACLNTLVQFLIGASVFVTLWFAFKSTPVTAFQLHIGLSVIGYQLLMSQGILSLNSFNSWSAPLTFRHRRRVHWVLQLAGSAATISGSVIMMNQKSVNFNTVHGKLALAAFILTCISLINGLTSLYSVELRRLVPAKVSKISHIILGTAAFTTSSVCLVFGYNKNSFKEWASQEFAYLMISITSTYTSIIVFAPCYTVWRKIFLTCKNKMC